MAPRRRLFELEGLKFEIGRLKVDITGEEGEQQLTALTDEITRVIAAPVNQVLRPQLEGAAPVAQAATVVAVAPEKRSARRTARPRVAANAPSAGAAATAFDWKPDIQKHGNPTDGWVTADRAMWLLGCFAKDHAGKENAAKGLSQPGIIATFRKHFSHLREIRYSNLKRDMKKLASAERPKVHADRTQSPAIWSLTDVGVAYVDEMIKTATTPVLTGAA